MGRFFRFQGLKCGFELTDHRYEEVGGDDCKSEVKGHQLKVSHSKDSTGRC